MTTEVVVATLNVSFDSEAASVSGNLKLEIDDRPTGGNKGNTSFKPGDDVYYLQFKDSNVSITAHVATAGGTAMDGSVSGLKTIDEPITFSNSDTSSLGYPPDGAVTMEWLGKSFEVKSAVDTNDATKTIVTLVPNTTLPEIERSELRMADGKKVVGVLRCQYSSTADVYKLSKVPKDFKEAMIISVGTYENA